MIQAWHMDCRSVVEGGAVCGRVAHSHARFEAPPAEEHAWPSFPTGSLMYFFSQPFSEKNMENIFTSVCIQFLRAKGVPMSQRTCNESKGFEKLLAQELDGLRIKVRPLGGQVAFTARRYLPRSVYGRLTSHVILV